MPMSGRQDDAGHYPPGHCTNCVGCIRKARSLDPRRRSRAHWTPECSGHRHRQDRHPTLKVPLIFKSRPHAPQPSKGRARGDDERPRLYGGPMASVKRIQVTFDCAEPERVARFWCEVLGYVVPPPPAGFATWDDFDRALPPEHQGSAFACIDPSGAGPRLFFQRVPESKDTCVKVRFKLTKGSLADAPTLARRATWSSRTHQMHPRNRASRTHQMGIRWCIPGSVRCGL